jgi:hypothetical protein
MSEKERKPSEHGRKEKILISLALVIFLSIFLFVPMSPLLYLLVLSLGVMVAISLLRHKKALVKLGALGALMAYSLSASDIMVANLQVPSLMLVLILASSLFAIIYLIR